MIARPTSGEVANPAAASASISVDLPEPGPPVTTWSESVLIARPRDSAAPRSEEHTSELQSLMRISYAVFCLKKKKNKRNNRKLKITNTCEQRTSTQSKSNIRLK